MAKRCFNCKSTELVAAEHEDRLEVAGHCFVRSVPSLRCARCGEETMKGEELEAFEVEAAAEFARHGEHSAEAFKFMRRILGLKAVELGELLDVTPETISRWENEKQAVERRAAALLCAMVLDKVEGRTSTLDRLRALRDPAPLPKRVNLAKRSA
jgi:putative zinc finger/helix-turn-helix YgiT family protein